MRIFDKVTIDADGRVTLGPKFIPDGTTAVVFVVEDEMIAVYDANTIDFGVVSKVDQVHRVVIPKWLRHELGDNTELYCTEMDGKFYLSKKTGYII